MELDLSQFRKTKSDLKPKSEIVKDEVPPQPRTRRVLPPKGKAPSSELIQKAKWQVKRLMYHLPSRIITGELQHEGVENYSRMRRTKAAAVLYKIILEGLGVSP